VCVVDGPSSVSESWNSSHSNKEHFEDRRLSQKSMHVSDF